jgi:hypothetical protein
MGAVRVAFKFLNDDDIIPPGYTEVKGSHLIFDIKMEDFWRKSRYYVAGGHMVDAPSSLTYASVVSRETVRVALTLLAALNAERESRISLLSVISLKSFHQNPNHKASAQPRGKCTVGHTRSIH